jgi:hypothetical protein
MPAAKCRIPVARRGRRHDVWKADVEQRVEAEVQRRVAARIDSETAARKIWRWFREHHPAFRKEHERRVATWAPVAAEERVAIEALCWLSMELDVLQGLDWAGPGVSLNRALIMVSLAERAERLSKTLRARQKALKGWYVGQELPKEEDHVPTPPPQGGGAGGALDSWIKGRA